MGSEIHRPDGTTILALGTPDLGFHASIHPSGLIKVSDRLGFDRRIDLRLSETVSEVRYAIEAFAETILASVDTEPEIDADLIALGNPDLVQRRLFRRNRHGIDLDPFAALRPPGLEFPFVIVDQEAVTDYFQTYSSAPTVMVAPKSHRAVFAAPGFGVVSLQFSFADPMELVSNLPFGDQIVGSFQASIEYLRDLPEEAGIEPLAYIQNQLESLDRDRLSAEVADLLGGLNPPMLRRFTTEGFQPLQTE